MFFSLLFHSLKAAAGLPKSPTPEKKRKLEISPNVSFSKSTSPAAQNKIVPSPSSATTRSPALSSKLRNSSYNSSISLGETSSFDSRFNSDLEEEEEDNFSILSGEKQEFEEEYCSTDEEEEQLTDMMSKSLKLSEKKKKKEVFSDDYQKLNLPHLIYTWKDSKRVDMVSLEIHLPSATIPDEYHMQLELKGGKHFFVLKHTLSPAFIDQEAFEASLLEDQVSSNQNEEDDDVENLDGLEPTPEFLKDMASVSLARSDHIKDLKDNFSESTDIRKEFSMLKMRLELPFFCEDIFDVEEYHGRYNNTGHSFKTWTTLDDMDNKVQVNCLSIILAAKKREKTPVKLNTPQRKEIAKVFSRKKI